MLNIKYHLYPKMMPDRPTQLQLENAAKDPDAFHHVAAMPDVHPKIGRKCPTGTILASKNRILPQVMDTAPNCGMRLIATPWSHNDLSAKQIDQLFQALVKTIPTRAYIGSLIDKKTALGICRYGVKSLLDYLKVDHSELVNTYKNGNFFSEPPSEKAILNAVPKIFLFFATFRLGIQGEAGNHFLDLMRIQDILDPNKAKALDLKKDQLVFLSHTGSGVFGQYASYFFTPKKEEHLSMKIITNLGRFTFNSDLLSREQMKKLQQKVKVYREKTQFFKINPKTKVGQAYLISHRASANYGFANRTMIMHNLSQTIAQVFNQKHKLKVVCDIPHVFVDQEEHYNRQVWLHRNGATPGFGPTRMSHHPIFSQTGQPGILAGSMNTPSYLVCGLNQNHSTFYSINHGAGRAKSVSQAAPKTKRELLNSMRSSQVKLYNAKSKGVIKQASQYYKDIDEILKVNRDFQISKPVAKLQPIAVLMA
ncbi:MAG: hypothetical protein GF332_02730 [Candidatus Moranbacteria bacterium]|nr:hypothetical protein [Candidatus Moranbacteria bacterium]